MTGITQNVSKTSKQLAIDAAKRAAREPYEILKGVRSQVLNIPEKGQEQGQQAGVMPEQGGAKQEVKVDKAKLRAQSVRQMQALEAELQQIRQMKMQKKENEIKQEEIKEEQQEAQAPQAPPQIVSKPKRGLLASASWRIGKGKRKLSQLQQSTGTSRVEFRKPPSG